MILFSIVGKSGEYPQVVLKGKYLYLKIQELLLGFNQYKEFPTSKELLKDLTIKIIDIDISPEEINKETSLYFARNKTMTIFKPLYNITIKNNYEELEMEESFEFYENLCSTYGKEKLNRIVYLALYKNVSKNWLSIYFDLELYELDFILDYLGVYLNYLEMEVD